MITNKGKELWAAALGSLGNDFTGTVKATTTTTLEPAEPTEVKWTAEQFVGQDVYSGTVVGTILSNTTEKLTVARWEKLPYAKHLTLNRSEEAAEPIVSAAFSIASGRTPAAWIGISADTVEPKATNETLKGEIGIGKAKSSKFGLVRSLAKFTYIGGKEYKVEVTFTAGTEDELPVTLAKIGVFNAQNNGVMMFESLLTATAEIKSEGDSRDHQDVVTGS